MRMRRIRTYLINQRMQLGLTCRLVFILVLFALFIGFEVYITVWPVVSGIISKDLMSFVRYQILFRLAFFALPILFVVVVFSIVFTHRIAGPLFRIEKTIERLVQGEEVEDVRLRKGDELHGLASTLNELIRMIRAFKASRGIPN